VVVFSPLSCCLAGYAQNQSPVVFLWGCATGFTICYSFQGQRRVLEHPANYLSPHDAVCYALFDSPAALRERPSNWEGSYSAMVELAEQLGVTDVSWHQSISHPHRKDITVAHATG